MAAQQSSPTQADYVERMRHFVQHHCAGKQYDTCTVCRYYFLRGCSHPEHPANQDIVAFQPEEMRA